MAKDFVQLDLLEWEPIPHPSIVFESEKETAMRDSICKEWRSCQHGAICMDDAINAESCCYIDEPDKLPRGAFSRCELKVLAAGFNLVRYTRDEKKIELSEADPVNGWTALEPYPTYAAAERKLKELKENGFIETGLDGKIIMTGWNQPGGLLKTGFEFYRAYGFHSYDTSYCIKIGSKNWSNLAKYKDQAELHEAWNKLMTEDLKALEG